MRLSRAILEYMKPIFSFFERFRRDESGAIAAMFVLVLVVLMGVSRTSKTPTCIYLANRGIRAANIPIVPGCALPEELFTATNPLIIGLTKDPKRLVEIRRQRLRLLDQDEGTDYVDLEKVSTEINDARRLFTKHDWPVINVSRKSIEETAATIIQLYNKRKDQSA